MVHLVFANHHGFSFFRLILSKFDRPTNWRYHHLHPLVNSDVVKLAYVYSIRQTLYHGWHKRVHLLLEPKTDEALSAYMQWVTGCYSCYLRTRTETVGHGHVFQRRFWSVGVEDMLHFLMVLRYIEANPLRAKLVDRAELVNLVQLPELLERLRKQITPTRGRPAVS